MSIEDINRAQIERPVAVQDVAVPIMFALGMGKSLLYDES